MMQMQNFSKDFVIRTKEIIENNEITKANKNDVTLLLNCLLGLISVATETTKSSETDFIAACVRKLDEMNVVQKYKNDDKTFRALKNALSHVHIEPGNVDGKIEHVIFGDKYSRKESSFHTELKFTVEQLREYALFVADLHLEREKTRFNKIPDSN